METIPGIFFESFLSGGGRWLRRRQSTSQCLKLLNSTWIAMEVKKICKLITSAWQLVSFFKVFYSLLSWVQSFFYPPSRILQKTLDVILVLYFNLVEEVLIVTVKVEALAYISNSKHLWVFYELPCFRFLHFHEIFNHLLVFLDFSQYQKQRADCANKHH